MNHEWLRSFETFARRLNFTQAARELHISQPSLHVQIRKLAEEIGVPLYVRRGRRLFLTAEGERLAGFARELRERTDAVLEDLRGTRAAATVILASGPGAYLYMLGDVLRRFGRREWPLRLSTMNAAAATRRLRQGEVHLAVTALEEPAADLVATHLCAVGQVVAVPRNHPLSVKKQVTPTDLRGERIIVPPERAPHRLALARILRLANVQWKVALEAPGWELILHFAALGLGITVVNDFCKMPRGLVARPLTGFPPIDYYLLERPGYQHAGVQELKRMIVESVGG